MTLTDTDITVLNDFNSIVSGDSVDTNKFLSDVKFCTIKTIDDIERELNNILVNADSINDYYLGLAMLHFEVSNYLDTLTDDGICY